MLVYIDDATGRLFELQFTDSETAFDYFHSTKRYLEQHGKPVAFCSDKYTVFSVNKTGATTGNGLTQFRRALHALNIEIIYANSSQAKGRVEGVNKTLQNRFVKKQRRQSINTTDEANTYLPTFTKRLNAKFAKETFNATNLHRPLTELDQIDDIFTRQEDRTLTNNLTVQYDRVVYLLEVNEEAKDLRRKRVRIFDYPDGTLSIKYDSVALPCEVFDRVRQVKQADIISNKHRCPTKSRYFYNAGNRTFVNWVDKCRNAHRGSRLSF